MDPLKSQSQPESKLHFLDYWRIIRIRKTVILAVFLLVVITATLVTFILPEQYASTARIKIDRDSPDIPAMGERQPYLPYDPYFINTEFEVIQSELILGQVIERLDLNTAWGEKYYGGQKLKTPETMDLLRGRISLQPVRNTSLIEIRVYNEDKDEAALLANTIAEVYRDHRLEEQRRRVRGGIKVLEDRYKEQVETVRKLQVEVDQLRKELGVSDLDAQGMSPTPLLESEVFRRLTAMMIERETDLMALEKQYSQLKALPPEKLREVLPTTAKDLSLSELLSQQNAVEQTLARMPSTFGPDHPDYKNAIVLAAKLEAQISERVEGIMNSFQFSVDGAREAVDGLQKKVDEAKQTDLQTVEKSRPYFDKRRELEIAQRMLTALDFKITQEEVDVELPRTGMVEIVDLAVAEKSPVRPNKLLNIILGVVIGLIVGVGLAFFIEYLDTSIKTIDDVERALQSPVLGVIPQNVGFLFEEGSESPHAEAYRVLRTNLLFSRKDEKLNSIAVVSAGAGEGKSTTVLNLATVFAQSEHRTIIVDSDLRRPTLHKMMRLSNTIGLTNYLLKQSSLEEVVQRSPVPNLDFMASGKLPSSSLGILSSNQMKDLIAELKQRYDFVFLDSPPVMGVSDASILASEVDITLQVIQYRRYPQPMNIRAKQLIEKVGGNLVGIVLNNINMSQDESYYYYSGYYHEYYSKSEDAAPAEEKASGDEAKIEIKSKY